jgi:PAS domain S-box-containing protein
MIISLIGTIQDITDRKTVQLELSAKNAEFERLNEELNAAMEEMNATNEELTATMEEAEAVNESLSTSSVELDLKNRELVKIQSALKDALAEAQRSRDELDRYFTSALDLLCIADTGGHFVRLNPEWEKVLGYSTSDLEGKLFLDFVHPDDLDQTLKALSKLAAQEQIPSFENRYRCKDGSYRWIEWRSDSQGDRIYAVARDITSRKLAEEKAKDLLDEKEVILKEVHHRIKNNMSTIASLLSLQAGMLKDSSAVTALKDAESRVMSMAILYDTLYNSPNFRETSVLNFIPRLIDEILSNFPNRQSVKVEKKIDDLVLDAKRLHTLGIIINLS